MVSTFIERLETAGAVLHVDAGELVVKASALTAAQADTIRAHKPAIISFLADRGTTGFVTDDLIEQIDAGFDASSNVQADNGSHCRRLVGNGFPPHPTEQPPASIIDTSVYCSCGNKLLPELRSITGEVCWACHQQQGATA